jgi:hypothetical protein
VLQISTLNLLWTTLALLTLGYLILWRTRHILTFMFAPYVLMIYFANIGSPILGSTHRYFTLMFPIFVMFTALHGWLARRASPVVAWSLSGCLLLVNAAYGELHTAAFNQGVWLWF